MYSTKIISYITRAADKSINVKYPSNEIGYGKLNLEKVFNNIAGIYRGEFKMYEEFYRNSLFIRKPYKMEVKTVESEI